MIVRGYSLDLYCNNAEKYSNMYGSGRGEDIHEFNEFPKNYFGESRQECVRAARSDGWKINLKAGTCICPKCNKRCER